MWAISFRKSKLTCPRWPERQSAYIYIHTRIYMYVCICVCLNTHTQRHLCMGARFGETSPVPWLREQRSPNRTLPSRPWRTSPRGSLAGYHAPIPLVLGGWRAESWPVLGIAEKHKKCLWFWLFPRDLYPFSDSPHTAAKATAYTHSFSKHFC